MQNVRFFHSFANRKKTHITSKNNHIRKVYWSFCLDFCMAFCKLFSLNCFSILKLRMVLKLKYGPKRTSKKKIYHTHLLSISKTWEVRSVRTSYCRQQRLSEGVSSSVRSKISDHEPKTKHIFFIYTHYFYFSVVVIFVFVVFCVCVYGFFFLHHLYLVGKIARFRWKFAFVVFLNIERWRQSVREKMELKRIREKRILNIQVEKTTTTLRIQSTNL